MAWNVATVVIAVRGVKTLEVRPTMASSSAGELMPCANRMNAVRAFSDMNIGADPLSARVADGYATG
jgi:hypothetical protein